MDEMLIGYLLGALEAGEVACVEQKIRSDGQISRRLETWRLACALLVPATELDEAPAGLARRTCQVLREIRAMAIRGRSSVVSGGNNEPG